MTDADRRALAILVTLPGLVGPGHFGSLLWSHDALSNGYRGSNCSAPYARPAGKVLNRLRKQGFAEWVRPSKDEWGWRATREGHCRFAEQFGE